MIIALLFMVAMATTETAVANGSGTYVIILPSTLRPNADFTVSVNILEATQDVNINATIRDWSKPNAVANGNGVFQVGQPETLSIKIPKSLTRTRSLFNLKVEGSGGLTFTNWITLSYTNKELLLFIQTDKGIYKAGDTVNFRVFGTYSDLKPYLDHIDIEIFDKDSNTIKQWLQVKPKDGVITQMLKLSSQPPLGDWKISAKASRTITHKTFAVAEYVLPKFEVSVELPSYVLTTETDFTATVKAKYTYGKPVKGTADVAVSFIQSWRYPRYLDRTQTVTTFIQVPVDGEAKVTIPLVNLKSLDSYLDRDILIVSANVTESLTGNVMAGNATVTMYDTSVKLEFPKSNPKTFKPGLTYTALLKVSQPDGLPVHPGAEQITVSTRVTIELPKDDTKTTLRPWLSNYPQTQSINLADVLISVPDNGLVAIPVTVQPDARDVAITAKLSGATTTLKLGKSHSPSNSYIQLALKTTSRIQAGDNIDLEVSSTQPLTQLVYQVLSRGQIVKTGTVPSQNQKLQPFVLATDVSMTPNARIVVYYVRADGEIVTDSISFNVDGAFLNKVSVKLDTTDAGPGDTVAVTVNADPSSAAYLAAIDQSVLLLRSGNDVTADDVMVELEEYDTLSKVSSGGGFGGMLPDCINCRGKRSIWWGWPVSYGGNDTKQIFENSGVSVMTDCLVYHYVDPYRPRFMQYSAVGRTASGDYFTSLAGVSGVARTAGVSDDSLNLANDAPSGDLMKPSATRSFFPESWLWTQIQMSGANGTATTKATIPDTITSWVVSAFATNPMSGLGIAPTQAHLTVFKPFFVSLNLPYSVTRGEHLALQANVFNYLQQDVTVRVTLAKSSEFFNIFIGDNKLETWRQEEVYQDIMVAEGEAKSVYFPIIPSELGRINLEVKAQSTVAADAVRRQLLVEAEGVPKEYNVPVPIDLTDGRNSFSETVNITLPATTVKGSKLVRVSAVGDLMAPTLAGLDSLLRLPTGCGEQTMLSLAPNVYVIDYLKSANQLTLEIETKALDFTESGYQRELTYKHKDGSFSAFGERDDSGSMWLTAFVTRVFHQAKSHIFVDDNVIIRAIHWMISHQATNGSFPEPGQIITKGMQGEAGGGLGLTCFVYISLLENQDLYTAGASKATFERAKARALTYLETQVATTSDVYILAMASYAFQLAKSSQAQNVLDRLEALAVKEGNMRYWHKPEAPKAKSGSWRPPHGATAVDTEMSSYVLLAYAVKADIVGGKGILQWVAQQRNPNGGFSSTQDTVVALNAMSEFAKLAYSNNFHVHITAQLDAAPVYTFDIQQSNSLILQTRETKTVPSQVKIDATGSGLALVDVAVFFNIETEVEDLTFDLTVTMIEETMNWLVVETCTRWLGESESSAMAVEEIGIPSGFVVDPETITALPILKRTETQNKKIVLYFDEIGKADVCLTFRAQRTSLVAKSQPTAVRVYDYYEPGNQVTQFYQSKILKESSMCEVCVECENCV